MSVTAVLYIYKKKFKSFAQEPVSGADSSFKVEEHVKTFHVHVGNSQIYQGVCIQAVKTVHWMQWMVP